jgi:hypothetical protein
VKDKLPGKDGKFEIEDLEPGDYTLSLRQDTDANYSWRPAKPRHSYGAATGTEAIHLTEGERRDVEFRQPTVESHSVTGLSKFLPDERGPAVTLWHMGVAMPSASQRGARPILSESTG